MKEGINFTQRKTVKRTAADLQAKEKRGSVGGGAMPSNCTKRQQTHGRSQSKKDLSNGMTNNDFFNARATAKMEQTEAAN